MIFLRIFTCVLIAGLVSACSPGTPSESDGRAVFEHQLQRQLGKVPYVLNSFEKTNGEARTLGGATAYVLSYQADVSYPEGFRPECVAHSGQFVGWDCWLGLSQGLSPKAKGERSTSKGEIPFEKTERGWRGPDDQLY